MYLESLSSLIILPGEFKKNNFESFFKNYQKYLEMPSSPHMCDFPFFHILDNSAPFDLKKNLK